MLLPFGVATLSLDRLSRLAQAAESAGLGFPDQRRLLLHGLPAGFVALMPVLAVPRQQLLADLQRLNTARPLADGTVPLRIWLDNARMLVIGEPAEGTFTQALAWVAEALCAASSDHLEHEIRASRQAGPIFISHAEDERDRAWAAWLAAVLSDAGGRVTAAVIDDVPGTNWILRSGRALDEGGLVLAVLSAAYLGSARVHQEWALAAQRDDGRAPALVPVFVEPVEAPGFLRLRTPVHLHGLAEAAATRAVLGLLAAPRSPSGGEGGAARRPPFPGRAD